MGKRQWSTRFVEAGTVYDHDTIQRVHHSLFSSYESNSQTQQGWNKEKDDNLTGLITKKAPFFSKFQKAFVQLVIGQNVLENFKSTGCLVCFPLDHPCTIEIRLESKKER